MLTLTNPLWHKLQRMGRTRALFTVPQYFKYYTEDKISGDLTIPRGLLKRVSLFLKDVQYLDKRSEGEKIRVESKIKLRDYQIGDVEQILQYENGIIKLGTGYGKTFSALSIIAALKRTTLIIVPRLDLLSQFKRAIEDSFENCHIGSISGGKIIPGDIVLTTIQSLQRYPRERFDSDISNAFGCVIFDEASSGAAKKTRAVIERLNPKWLFGLSATPDREDGQGQAIQFLFGPIIIDKELPQKKPSIEIRYWNGHIDASFNYAEIVDSQVKSEERNQFIVEIAKEQITRGRKTIILTKRIAHFKSLIEMLLREQVNCLGLESSTKKSNREKIMKSLQSGELKPDVICGTFSLLSTGVDIAFLDTLIIAGDLRSGILTQQSAGRCTRILQGKCDPLIIDVADRTQGILFNQHKQRVKKYRELGWLL